MRASLRAVSHFAQPTLRTTPLPHELAAELVRLAQELEEKLHTLPEVHVRPAYRHDWMEFARYAAARDRTALPADPSLVAAYLASVGERLSPSAIRHRAAAIAQAHREAGHLSPATHRAVRALLGKIAPSAPKAIKRKSTLTEELLERVLVEDGGLRGLRDRALLCLGFATALRRSELVALDVEDLRFDDRGLTIRAELRVPFAAGSEPCAASAVRAWIEAAALRSGPLFRSFTLPRGRGACAALSEARLPARDVARIVQRAVAAAGIEGDFSGHSLRSGFIVSALRQGNDEESIRRVTRHRSPAALRDYVVASQARRS